VVAVELDRQSLFNSAGNDLVSLMKFLQVATERMEERMQHAPKESEEKFFARLSAEALSHRAIRHPYLLALSSGDLPDPRWALTDFGLQYYGYSAHFPRYLTQTISQLTTPSHRTGLLQNLTEESGEYDALELEELSEAGIPSEWIVGVPHPELFKRFCDALDIRLGSVEEDAMEVICWREMFLDVLGGGSPAQAIGALGLGTENIVSTMYQNFLPALGCIDIEPRDAVFFPLHALVDDHHQAILLNIARDFAGSEEGRRDLTKGMRKALYLRAGFWDWLHSRALDPERAEQSAD
jgi:pyrroloquinoline quinone (PQQ) biosynthesis protein C